MVKKTNHKTTSAEGKKERKPVVAMVPLFHWRTMLAVAIGLIVGAGLGLGYWYVNPSVGFLGGQAEAGSGGGLTQFLAPSAPTTDVPWSSRVYIQVVNQGSSYISLRDLQNKGEYYAAKANSLPFLEFLIQELGKQAPEYSHTVDELDNMIRVRYSYALNSTGSIDSEIENPAIEVKVTGTSVQEVLFLTKFVPQAFESYLVAEENDKQKQEYQNTLKEMESVKAVLYEAEKELDSLTPKDVLNNPNYIALNARLQALERGLDTQAVELTTLGRDIQQEYTKTWQQVTDVSAALVEAEQELRDLEEQGTDNDISSDATYITLNTKVSALERELNRLMTGWTETTSNGVVEREIGLAEMLVNNMTTGADYKDRLKKVETASAALAEAKKELAILERQSDDKNLAKNMDYQLAQIKVDTLNAGLSALQERLAILGRESVDGDSPSDAQAAFERTAAALAEAKKELAILESQLGYDRLAVDLEYKVAKDKVDDLNERMNTLTQKLSLLVGDNVESSEMADYLVAGNPSMPIPVFPERMRVRNVLMMGAMVGIGGAWAILNFRWILKGMTSSSTGISDEDEDEV